MHHPRPISALRVLEAVEDVISITWGVKHVVHLLKERDALAVGELPCGGAIFQVCHSPDSCNRLGMLLEK
eukprot:7254209-Ditylum_brightwellii.AAC.1